VSSLTDEQLMVAVRDGDASCLGDLFERHGEKLCGYLTRVTQDPELARDFVQEVFLRVLKYRGTYKDGNRFSSWMYTIAHNVVNRHFGKKSTGATVINIEDVATMIESREPSPFKQAVAAEEQRLLKAAFAELPVEKREILTLGMIERMPYKQVAEVLGVSESAVKVRVHRAVKELRAVYMRLANEEENHGS